MIIIDINKMGEKTYEEKNSNIFNGDGLNN